MSGLSFQQAQANLSYDPDTGVFIWSEARRSDLAGRVAGTIHATGYRFIQVNRKLYLAHRLAWLMSCGAFPEKQIDHINGDRADNRICNLRLATQSQNAANRGTQKNNTSGAKGVCRQKSGRKWRVMIMHEGRNRYLGSFDKFEDAKAAYDTEAIKLRGVFAFAS